jgi:hypothetical protein
MHNLDSVSQQLALSGYLLKPPFTLGTKLPQAVEPLMLGGDITERSANSFAVRTGLVDLRS